jgi:hypothetical protein
MNTFRLALKIKIRRVIMDEEAMAQQGRSLPEIILLAKGIYVWLVPLMSFILLV